MKDDTRWEDYEFIHISDVVKDLKPKSWQIDGILPKNGFYYNFGETGHYKTFTELDRMLHIACGLSYHGHAVKQGTCFYICGEGEENIGRRVLAWCIFHNIKPKAIPFHIGKTGTRLTDPNAVGKIRESIDKMDKKYGKPAVVHIDTLSRNFGSGDELSHRDMNIAIQNLDAAFKGFCCYGFSHHTGHTNKERAKGPYSLPGCADSVFRIALTKSEQIIVENIKQKDSPKNPPMLFNKKIIGMEIQGKYEDSCILEFVKEDKNICIQTSQTQKASKNMLNALTILNTMHENNDSKYITVTDWQKECLEKKIYTRASVFKTAYQSMLDRNCIFTDETGSFVYTIEMFDKINCDKP